MSDLATIHNQRTMTNITSRLLATENALRSLGMKDCETCGQWAAKEHRIDLYGNAWCLDCLEHNEDAIESMPLEHATPFQLWEFMEPWNREIRNFLCHGIYDFRNTATGKPRVDLLERMAGDIVDARKRGRSADSMAFHPVRRKSDLYLMFLEVLRDLGREDELGQHPNENIRTAFRFSLIGLRWDEELKAYLDLELEQAWREVRYRIIEEPSMEAFKAGKEAQ